MKTAAIVNRLVKMFPDIQFLFLTEHEVTFVISDGKYVCKPRMDGGKPTFRKWLNETGFYTQAEVDGGNKLAERFFSVAN